MFGVDEVKAARIAKLNDIMRSTWGCFGILGEVRRTEGFFSLPAGLQSDFIEAMESYNDFPEDNDPYHERDMGFLAIDGIKVNWKIDYFDKSPGVEPESWLSPDPSNVRVTKRILTIYLASEQ